MIAQNNQMPRNLETTFCRVNLKFRNFAKPDENRRHRHWRCCRHRRCGTAMPIKYPANFNFFPYNLL